MNTKDFDRNELLRLIAEVEAGSIDCPDRERLNEVLKASSAARVFYREHMELHARLILDYRDRQATEFMPGNAPPQKRTPLWGRWIAIASAAAAIVLAAILAWPRDGSPETESFAMLETSKAARWEASGLPTTDGSRLGAGELRLAEGLATLRFDSGAKVVIEGPADIRLEDSMQMHLAEGKAFAEIPESAKGFRIVTPIGSVVDHGTRFSVVVDGVTGGTYTKVYEGSVRVEHARSGEGVNLETGEFNHATTTGLGEIGSDPLEYSWPDRVGPLMRGPDWILLPSTKDAYIGRAFRNKNEVHRSDTLLLVKNGGPRRKAYIGFDLTDISPENITEAELMLHFAPTGWGFASLVPDATFSVYGLKTNQSWNEGRLNVDNAPASPRPKAGERFTSAGPILEAHKVQKLGSFLIEQGVQSGQFGIEGKDLTEFLRRHAGSTVTLIVVRDTEEIEMNGLVHGFASRRHPTLPAPTLAIRLSKR